VFFAIATPIMLKLLPKLIEGQLNADLSSFFVVNKRIAIQSYIGDLMEIGYLVVILALSGILSDELNSKKLVFPYSKGGSPSQMVFAKFIHYALTIVLVLTVGFTVNHYYVNIIISGEGVAFSGIMISAFLISLYFIFGLSIAMFFSSLFEKALTAGIVTLAVSYLMILVAGVKVLKKLIPYNLIQSASEFTLEGTLTVIASTLTLTVIMVALTCYRMGKVEII
jgi:ABC-2 type transport system permease protein